MSTTWFIFAVLLLTEIEAIEFQDCYGEYVVESVDIDICKIAPCNILQGTTLNVTTKFTPNTNTGSLPRSLTNDVYIMINNVHIGVTVQPNFCDYSGLCPLRATRLSYTSKITVTADVPPFNGHVHWSMYNELNEPMVCYIFDIKVIEPSSSSLVEKIRLKMDNDSSSYHLRGNYPYH